MTDNQHGLVTGSLLCFHLLSPILSLTLLEQVILPKHARHAPTLGPLERLIPLPGMHSPPGACVVCLLPFSKSGLIDHLFSRAFPDHPTFIRPQPILLPPGTQVLLTVVFFGGSKIIYHVIYRI